MKSRTPPLDPEWHFPRRRSKRVVDRTRNSIADQIILDVYWGLDLQKTVLLHLRGPGRESARAGRVVRLRVAIEAETGRESWSRSVSIARADFLGFEPIRIFLEALGFCCAMNP